MVIIIKEINNNFVIGVSKTCFESYLIYGLIQWDQNWNKLLFNSNIGFLQIINDLRELNGRYLKYDKIDDLLSRSVNMGVVNIQGGSEFPCKGLNDTELFFSAIEAQYINQKFNIELLSNIHYVMIYDIDSNNYAIANDYPFFTSVISKEEFKKIYSGWSYLCMLNNKLSEEQIQKCNSIFMENLNNIECNYGDCSGLEFEKALDILMIARITRTRMLYFCNNNEIKKIIKCHNNIINNNFFKILRSNESGQYTAKYGEQIIKDSLLRDNKFIAKLKLQLSGKSYF